MYYTLPLTTSDSQKGMLQKIHDHLTTVSDVSLKRARDIKGLNEYIIEVFFEDSTTTPEFNDKWEGFDIIVYLNETAYLLLKRADIVGDLQKNELPKNFGEQPHIPFYN